MSDISVIIPTYNRARTLDLCLSRLETQDLAPERFEIVVADDASVDSTEDVVRRHQAESAVHIQYRRCPKSYAGGARNRGRQLATSERLLFLGDDVLAAPGLVRAHVEAQEVFGSDAVLVGQVHLNADPVLTPFMRFLEEEGVHHDFHYMSEHAAESLPGWYFYACNASLPAALFDAVGGFDERIQRAWEDTEFGFRLARAGADIRFLPSATGEHLHRSTLESYWRFLRGGRADVARALDIIRDLGGPVAETRPHPVLERVVSDRLVATGVRAASAVEERLPQSLARRLYRAVLRYERARAVRMAYGSAGTIAP